MGERRIIEIDYPEFQKILEFATLHRHRIEPGDREAWKAYVRKHRVPEAGFKVRANSELVSGDTEAVIIDGTGEYDGYYLHSADDHLCLKFESGLD